MIDPRAVDELALALGAKDADAPELCHEQGDILPLLVALDDPVLVCLAAGRRGISLGES